MNDFSAQLTISSVYHSKESRRLLEINYDLTRSMNSGEGLRWVAVDNSPVGDDERTGDAHFTVLRGKTIKQVRSEIPEEFQHRAGSFHHSQSINLSLKHMPTRYGLILDNDFYLIRKEWVNEVLRHMDDKGLAFFGAPWHPRWWTKYRYFPVHHCLFIDFDKVSPSDLDFTPRFELKKPSMLALTKDRTTHHNPFPLFKRVEDSLDARNKITGSRDAGIAFYEQFHKGSLAYECLMPVFAPYDRASRVSNILKKGINAILPDRYSFVPKRGSYTTKGFAEFGYPDVLSQGWEEFMWRGEPFGFHMRRTQKDPNRTFADELKSCKDALEGSCREFHFGN